jgi:hypothetical protein
VLARATGGACQRHRAVTVLLLLYLRIFHFDFLLPTPSQLSTTVIGAGTAHSDIHQKPAIGRDRTRPRSDHSKP